MKRVAIIQARTGSTRLPGKVLMPLGGATVLGCVVDRLSPARLIDEVVVATSTEKPDDAVERHAQELGVRTFRGSAQDVLGRFYGAASAFHGEIVVRITADCPLIDAALIDAMLEVFAKTPGCDYLSNTLERTYPRGLDAEIFTMHGLERVNREAHASYEREHVTPYFYQHPEIFALHSYTNPDGTDHSQLRWTLDTPEDYAFLQAVYQRCAHTAPREVTAAEVIALLEREPDVAQLNARVPQKVLGE